MPTAAENGKKYSFPTNNSENSLHGRLHYVVWSAKSIENGIEFTYFSNWWQRSEFCATQGEYRANNQLETVGMIGESA